MENTVMELELEKDIDNSAEILDMQIVDMVKDMDKKIDNLEKEVDKQIEELQKDKSRQVVNPRKKMDKQNNDDKGIVVVPQNNNFKKINPTKVKDVAKKPIERAPVALKMRKKVGLKPSKSLVKTPLKSLVKTQWKLPVPKPKSPILAVMPHLKKSFLRKCNSKAVPQPAVKAGPKAQDKPGKRLILTWSRAETADLSEVSKMHEYNSIKSNHRSVYRLRMAK